VAERLARGAPLEVSATHDAGSHTGEARDFNFAAWMVEVRVDPDTGQVFVQDAVLVVDVGTVLNPLAHRGQLDGGWVFGLGGTLMEELPVEEGKVTTLNLGEYKLPTSMDTPPLRTVALPAALGPGPYGAKMAGELSNVGVAPAIANAVADATGARVMTLPLTAERVLRGQSSTR